MTLPLVPLMKKENLTSPKTARPATALPSAAPVHRAPNFRPKRTTFSVVSVAPRGNLRQESVTNMKTHPARTSLAFTLIELITVIAIISVLMALLFPHLAAARESARKQEAATVVRNVVNSCNSYKQDYGKYPPITAAADGTSLNPFMSFGDKADGKCKVDNNQLLDTLRAIDRGPNASNAMNPKQTKYYENKKASDPKNPRGGFLDGSEFESTKQGILMDPWGEQYCFILETDGDEVLDMSTFFQDLSGKDNYVRFAAVGFSMGKSGKIGGTGYEGRYRKDKSTEAPDDIVSWQ